ncbi:DUF1972 domain-containing protein [Niabella soli]|uniref:Glycosyl transferase n=1 Tax=Niabella soli DSM 19437 TaxID=929713 RepID=W0EYR0_9BACT|nr:DUF1972 domain-containing protein [Niabella soli]AHF14211.1 glycosyl transferase [Niabella soli DSM 19437]
MRIAIIGTRGIPNQYGGFEQFAEYLATGLQQKGFEVTVYNPEFHSFREHFFEGVKIVRKWSPEKQIGASANFIYDYLCLKDAIRKKFDIIYEAGYGTNSISHLFLNFGSSAIVTNMDGLEWKRAKWGPMTRWLTKYFEKLAVKTSHNLIADNTGIQKYLFEQYQANSHMIPYGAEIPEKVDDSLINQYSLQPAGYFLLIARLEPENNVEMIIDGYLRSDKKWPLICVGGMQTKHFKYLNQKIGNEKMVHFVGGIYKKEVLDALRKNALAYFHGHSVGGTNPSLLEAMAAGSFIAAHNNDFNRGVLEANALYFSDSDQVTTIINEVERLRNESFASFSRSNLDIISNKYSWEHIIQQYIDLFNKIYYANSRQNQK